MQAVAEHPAGAPRAGPWPAAALLLTAFVWGVSWWPFRQLEARGLHPLLATVLIYAVAVLFITALRPRAWAELLRRRSLWWLVLASGTTNAAFNWGVTAGDVVRVVLLFYLMPLWSVLLARALLREPLTGGALLRVALALGGALAVLWPAGGFAGGHWWERLPLPRGGHEWLGLLGGFSFALNNVLLRREAARSQEARALAMFAGGVLVAGAVAGVLLLQGAIAGPPPLAPGWLLVTAVVALFFLAGNLALQYGATRLPAHVTAVVLLSEVLIASASAVWLGAGTLTPLVALGGALIVGAALAAARRGA